MSFTHPHAEAEEEKKTVGVIPTAGRIWLLALVVLLAPAVAAWAVRGIGYALQCQPSAKSCLGAPFDALLGAALRTSLEFSWMLCTNVTLTLAISTAAAVAAIVALRPVSAALTMLIAPLAALWLPEWLVGFTAYDGCVVNEDGVGDCLVWGQSMGMAFHNAASAAMLIYTYAPLAVSGAVVAGLLGWIIRRGCHELAKT